MGPGVLSGVDRGDASVRCGGWRIGVALCFALLFVRLSRAQDGGAVPTASEDRYTLHVYEDLVQVPSLVLNAEHASYGGLEAKNFTVRLDSGPPFHPRHVRLQGDDAMTVAIVLDDSRHTDTHLVDSVEWAISGMFRDPFSPRDHLSIYAFDCNIVRFAAGEPGTLATLKEGVAGALGSNGLHAEQDGSPCRHRVHLWDAIGMAAAQIRDAPGRRVIVVLSAGVDYGSKTSWASLRRFAEEHSVTVLGIRPISVPLMMLSEDARREGRFITGMEDPFELLCGGSGGLVMEPTRSTLGLMMGKMIDLLRNRYILEFPRPSNGTAGQHLIDVTLKDESAIVRPSGIMVPLQDKTVLGDPSTVPTDPARAPVMGTRRILQQP